MVTSDQITNLKITAVNQDKKFKDPDRLDFENVSLDFDFDPNDDDFAPYHCAIEFYIPEDYPAEFLEGLWYSTTCPSEPIKGEILACLNDRLIDLTASWHSSSPKQKLEVSCDNPDDLQRALKAHGLPSINQELIKMATTKKKSQLRIRVTKLIIRLGRRTIGRVSYSDRTVYLKDRSDPQERDINALIQTACYLAGRSGKAWKVKVRGEFL